VVMVVVVVVVMVVRLGVNSQSQLKGISFARVLRFIKNKNLQKKDTYVDGENQAYKIGFHFVILLRREG